MIIFKNVRRIKIGRPAKDMTGQRFGRLTVIARAERPHNVKNKGAYWECICNCGNRSVAMGVNLRSGGIKSCGCLVVERIVGLNKTHGMSKSSEFSIWGGIKDRCYNPKTQSYKNYGAKGICMCDRWFSSFENFFEDMGQKPGPEYTIDRMDNNGNYELENCRWATMKEQRNNSCQNRYITYNGETLTMTQWAEKLDMNPRTLKSRLNISKWSIEKALTVPVKSRS